MNLSRKTMENINALQIIVLEKPIRSGCLKHRLDFFFNEREKKKQGKCGSF